MDRVEHMYEQKFGQLPNDQLHVSAEVREAFVKIHPVLKTARHDDEAAMAILELLIKKSPKKTPKKPSVLPDDSSGTASPHGPIADEQKGAEEHDSEFSFESMHEHEANILLDGVKNVYERQQGLLPDGQIHISLEAHISPIEGY